MPEEYRGGNSRRQHSQYELIEKKKKAMRSFEKADEIKEMGDKLHEKEGDEAEKELCEKLYGDEGCEEDENNKSHRDDKDEIKENKVNTTKK